MVNFKFLGSLATAVALMLAPTSAEARFGKRGGGGGSSSTGGAHAASPGGSYAGVPSYRGSYYYRPYYYGWPGYYYGWGFYPYFGFYAPYYYSPYASPYGYPYQYAEPQSSVTQQGPRNELKVTLGAEGQAYTGGGSVGVNLGLEGKRIGCQSSDIPLRTTKALVKAEKSMTTAPSAAKIITWSVVPSFRATHPAIPPAISAQCGV